MKIKFYTLGCKVNQYETEALKEKFIENGYEVIRGRADLCVINTCTVTKRADAKSFKLIQNAKKSNPGAKIAVIGCLAQLNAEAIRNFGVDYIIPQDKKHLLVDIISSKSDYIDNKGVWSLKISKFFNQRAFVKIQDGCDYFCSFCKIPYLRGRSISRDKKDIFEEIIRLVQNYKEIVLCGINLGLYGRDLRPKESLEGLLEEILKIDLSFRVRLSSIEPALITDRLISLFSNNKICPHIHMPFQSGDDYVLEKMNKKEKVSMYETIVKKLRLINPYIAISCDIMVGFPYEDEYTFKNTIDFLERIKPMRVHIFTFSPREKTKFFNFKMKDNRVVYQRYDVLRKLAHRLAIEYKIQFIDKTLNVLAEEIKDKYTTGYTENYIKVLVKEKLKIGEIFKVRITHIDKENVFGLVVK